MAADIEVGQNRPTFVAQNDLKKATAVALALVPKDAAESKWDNATKTGDATWTTQVVTHGLSATPRTVQITPTSAAAGLAAAAYWVTKQATTFTINFAAAPANAAVVSFDWQANI